MRSKFLAKEALSNLYSSLKDAQHLNLAIRTYSTKRAGATDIRTIKTENEIKFKKLIDEVADEFKDHKTLKHPFFAYLVQKSTEGFNSVQFQIYRDNFFHRTELTIPSVARAIEKAALSGDIISVADSVRNIYDEGGYGNPEKVHSKLLLDSHNFHGLRVFGVEPIHSLKDAKKSHFLTPEVKEYRKSKMAMLNKPYPYVAGNVWAHELAADNMLINFRNAFFEPYKGYYTEQEYDNLIEFYKAHRNDEVKNGDIEAQHERIAKAAAERACKENTNSITKIREGGLEFLNRQSNLWFSLLREMEKSQIKGGPILPKADFQVDKQQGLSPSSKLKTASVSAVKCNEEANHNSKII